MWHASIWHRKHPRLMRQALKVAAFAKPFLVVLQPWKLATKNAAPGIAEELE